MCCYEAGDALVIKGIAVSVRSGQLVVLVYLCVSLFYEEVTAFGRSIRPGSARACAVVGCRRAGVRVVQAGSVAA